MKRPRGEQTIFDIIRSLTDSVYSNVDVQLRCVRALPRNARRDRMAAALTHYANGVAAMLEALAEVADDGTTDEAQSGDVSAAH